MLVDLREGIAARHAAADQQATSLAVVAVLETAARPPAQALAAAADMPSSMLLTAALQMVARVCRALVRDTALAPAAQTWRRAAAPMKHAHASARNRCQVSTAAPTT
ncbi:hypothetical protein D9Q98_003697 [Chlorella vulgaris]|uniref:Uncharacterized protein n=1 Tax=Chlorella vulgaris TaxID=3077 RepID=A0A9D4YZN8_CHLVU|nr:hypothetical protein D9Q98_003697 [Chlorella vulgaris]